MLSDMGRRLPMSFGHWRPSWPPFIFIGQFIWCYDFILSLWQKDVRGNPHLPSPSGLLFGVFYFINLFVCLQCQGKPFDWRGQRLLVFVQILTKCWVGYLPSIFCISPRSGPLPCVLPWPTAHGLWGVWQPPDWLLTAVRIAVVSCVMWVYGLSLPLIRFRRRVGFLLFLFIV